MPDPKDDIRPAGAIVRAINRLSKIMALVAALCLAAMMLLTVADVAGRYFFKLPVTGAWEIISLLLVCSATWGLAYCQVEKGHISVNVLLQNFSPRLKSFVLCIAYLAGLIGFSALTFRAVQLAIRYMYEKGHTTDILHVPYFPFLLAMAVGTGVTALVLLVDLIKVGKEIGK